MEVFKNYEKLQKHLNPKESIGFVPTMGALHQGHLSLIKESIKHHQQTVVSIFVNPTQFDDTGDLDRYPRTLEKDLAQLASLNQNLWVYAPLVSEIYGPAPPVTNPYDFGALTQTMEGLSRAHHFQGVATVVEKLFRKVNPQSAYFGEKDFQQIRIIETLVAQKNLKIEIVRCPIVREVDGLAMSSRNTLLSPEERSQAPLLHTTLCAAKEQFLREQSIDTIKQNVHEIYEKAPLFSLDYFNICDENRLQDIKNYPAPQARGFLAAKLGKIRLIDNMPF